MKDLKDLVRPNVWNLKPYSSARDEFHGDASVFLDANENPWNVPYNRYPDPLQWKLKDRLAVLKGVDRNSIFLGNGSDEAIGSATAGQPASEITPIDSPDINGFK